ncbi:Disulfide bond formation protein D [Mycena chlorophos]|uniref:Disulfide bond formation protein D n=1 Tax=Mycena chlorophos TaxID=658473 RepID=A0A8H6SUH0_MYCCL|nr:Disulfide bond formation protein D [Mycena chlorophos]
MGIADAEDVVYRRGDLGGAQSHVKRPCLPLSSSMALQPTLRPLIIAGTPDAPHTLDIFLDYVCPFSAKLARAINTVLVPALGPGGKYHGKVKAIFRPQVQPWHASSTFVHEAGLAVARVSPESFWPFSLALFEHQAEYFDVPTSTLTPIQIRAKLAALAGEVVPAGAAGNTAGAFADLLVLKGTPNGGVDVTDDLKYTIKFSRQNGIHVSPTVLWDGLVANEISSSWGEKEWTEFLAAKVVV